MTVLRAGDIDRFLSRPDPKKPVVLVYGPDSGLVSERAGIVVRKMSGENADPFSLVQLDGDTIAADPGKLIDEAQTIGFFGNHRVIRVRAGTRNFTSAVETLLSKPPQATVVIEAGDLRPASPLRSICEKSQAAAVIPCYVDTGRDLARLISDSKLSFEPGAREELVALLGADRLSTRAELDKLALYAQGNDGQNDSHKVTVEDVRAVIADASALALDDVLDFAATGDVDYVPVTVTGTFLHSGERHFFTTWQGASGFDGLTPLALADGRFVFVNRGFVPYDRKDAATRPQGQVAGTVTVTGLARDPLAEKPSMLVPDNDPAKNIFYWKDLGLMAATAGLPAGAQVVPILIDADAAPNPGGLPVGGVTIVDLPNNPLQYAVTWYGLAAALAGVLIAWLLRQRKAAPPSS